MNATSIETETSARDEAIAALKLTVARETLEGMRCPAGRIEQRAAQFAEYLDSDGVDVWPVDGKGQRVWTSFREHFHRVIADRCIWMRLDGTDTHGLEPLL